MTNSGILPVTQSERLLILDSLRGIAVLGILIMNMPGFALSFEASFNPYIKNEYGTLNFNLWYIEALLPEGTLRALFSMLFGAGMILFISRLEKRTEGLMAAELFYRRQIWLMVFGLVNTYLFLWWGDILFLYAVVGMFLFPFRRLPARKLMIAAFICFLLAQLQTDWELYEKKGMIARGTAISKLDTTRNKLTEEQKDDLAAYSGFKEGNDLKGKQKRAAEEERKTRGHYTMLYHVRAPIGMEGHTTFLYTEGFFDALLFMLLGMALFKAGVLTGQASLKTYWLMTLLGLGLGILISAYRINRLVYYKFDIEELIKTAWFVPYQLSRLLRSIGLLGLLILMYRSGWFKWLFRFIQPVGQMAFSNYLIQSIICGVLFYGIGGGLFGRLQRYELYIIMPIIWAFQILFSNIWMHYFLYGPFEWTWRSLTYWKRQAFLRVRTTEKPALPLVE